MKKKVRLYLIDFNGGVTEIIKGNNNDNYRLFYHVLDWTVYLDLKR